MPPKKREGKPRGVKPQLQTVQDVEVKHSANPTPASPPATEEDRVNFQKLLLQMNGLNVSGKSHCQKTKGSDTTKSIDQPSLRPANPSQDKNEDSFNKPQSEAVSNIVNKAAKSQAERKKRSRNKNSSNIVPGSPSLSQETQETDQIFLNSNADLLKGKSKPQAQCSDATAGVSLFAKALLSTTEAQRDSHHSKKKDRQDTDVEKAVDTQPSAASNSEPVSVKKLSDKPTTLGEKLNKVNESSERNCSESKIHRQYDARRGSEVAPGRNSPQVKGLNEHMLVYDFSPTILLEASLNLVIPQKKDPTSLQCLPCDKVFVDLKRHFQKHKESHTFKWKVEMMKHTVKFLPPLSSEQTLLLGDLVDHVANKYGMTENQHKIAHDAWQRLQSLASASFPGCAVRWFGSHFSNIALADNKLLNMDLYVPNKEEAASTFLKFISVIEKDSTFGDVDRVIATNFAHANTVDKNSGYAIQLSLNNTGAYHTAKLIKEYVIIDPRVKALCIFFRMWGKVCGLDRGEDGSWQGHAFPIMVIHFLQQVGVLPVLQELLDNPDGNPETYLSGQAISSKWLCKNDAKFGNLLFEMLKYYAVEHNTDKHIVCITQLKPFLRSDTKWSAKRIAVMDPFQPKHNISRFITANMYDYVHHCLLSTVCGLGIPRTATGPLFGYILPGLNSAMFQRCPDILEQYHEISNMVFDLVLRGDETFDFMREHNDDVVAQLKASLQSSPVFKVLQGMKIVPNVLFSPIPIKPSENAYSTWVITPNQAVNLVKHLKPGILKYSFEKSIFTDNQEPPVSCTSCHRHGHIKTKCPDEVIPKMKLLPTPSIDQIRILDQLCLHVFDTWSSGPKEHEYRKEVREDLLYWLQQFYPDIDLHLFGSSCNGFGGKTSDIDMCLTYKDNATGEGLNFPSLVEEITKKLKGHRNVFRLLPITTAKVPIVKFEYGRNHIQVDMSLYNLLGIMNTKLLLTYSVIDHRVRPLVYMMKRLAKTTGIGDASRGSLSSYAYSLMTLYFLQQTNPPIIPVLQELSDPGSKPGVELIESANVYFFKNVERLDEIWPHRYKNESTLGELWLQLLEFYASDKFHRKQQVVCIRRKEPLYKFDKLWTSTNLCIEDPFDLNHNLGSGLTKRMNIFIVKTFQKALKHFHTVPKPDLLKDIPLEFYFFNEGSLSVGKPPSDRGCHFCHCLGHVQYDCPKRIMSRGSVGGKRGLDNNPGNRMNPVSKRMNSPRPIYNNFDNFTRRENQRIPNTGFPPPRPNHPIPCNPSPSNQVNPNLIPQNRMIPNPSLMNQIPPNLSSRLPPSQMPPNQLALKQMKPSQLQSNQISPNQMPPNQMHAHPHSQQNVMNPTPHGHPPLPAQSHPVILPVRPPPGFPMLGSGPPGRPMVRMVGQPVMPGIPLQGLPPQPPHLWR